LNTFKLQSDTIPATSAPVTGATMLVSEGIVSFFRIRLGRFYNRYLLRSSAFHCICLTQYCLLEFCYIHTVPMNCNKPSNLICHNSVVSFLFLCFLLHVSFVFQSQISVLPASYEDPHYSRFLSIFRPLRLLTVASFVISSSF
jgi:hypothetical protein